MAKPLDTDFGVFGAIKDEPSGCTYYRIQVPLRGLYNLGLSNVFIDKGKLPPETVAEMMLSADIVHVFALGGDVMNARIETMRGLNPGLSDDGSKTIYPPSVIFDMDDNLDWVHPFNYAYSYLGT